MGVSVSDLRASAGNGSRLSFNCPSRFQHFHALKAATTLRRLKVATTRRTQNLFHSFSVLPTFIMLLQSCLLGHRGNIQLRCFCGCGLLAWMLLKGREVCLVGLDSNESMNHCVIGCERVGHYS